MTKQQQGNYSSWKRGVVWALIAALGNPAFMVPLAWYSSPALARDTDIYMAADFAGTTAEPAIMLILDTSDSMNIPDGWKEYPGDYDSHIEYLWNDRNLLCGNGTDATSAADCTEVTAEVGGRFIQGATWDSASSKVNFQTTAAHGYAVGRNITIQGVIPESYNGEYTITDIPDATHFKVALSQNPGTYTGGGMISGKVSTAALTAYPSSSFGTWSGTTLAERQALWNAAKASMFSTNPGDPGPAYQWRNYNDLSWIYWLPVSASESDLRLTSPAWNRFRGYVQQIGANSSNHLGGAGGQKQRGGLPFMDTNDYRSYLACNAALADLTPSTVFAPSNTDRNAGKSTNQQLERWDPYLSLETVGNSGYPGYSDQQTTGYARGYLDESAAPSGSPSNNPVYRDNLGTNPIGSKGLPIRYADSSSGAGWSNIRADLGGFNFYNAIDKYTAATKSMLDTIASWYDLPAPADVDGSGTADIADSKFITWLGNRDASAPFGKKTGVYAYYDVSAGTGSAGGTCDAATGPASASCIGQTSGNTPAFTLKATASCNTNNAGTNESDAGGNSVNRGKTCSLGAVSYTADQNGAAYPNNADVLALMTCAPTTSNSSIKKIDYSGCTTSGGTTVVNPCTLVGQSTYTIGACGLSGGNSVTVGTCALSGNSTVSVGNCAWSGRSTYTVGTCAWSGRQSMRVEGLGYIAYGGSCMQNGSTTGCQISGVSTMAGQPNATGYYGSAADATAATAGCSNSVAAGTVYNYGGSCTENGSSASCTIGGGSTVSINGTTYNNVNGSCSNSLAAGTYKVGGTCMENGSAASCTTTAGGNVTIRGTLYTNVNNTCSNAVTAGTYKYGQTCSGTNNTCTAGSTTSKTIRGTSYSLNSGPGVTTTTCTGAAAQTINYGATGCSSTGSGVANSCTYNPGTTQTIGSNTYTHVGASCTAAVAAGTYNTGTCTGTIKTLSDTVGGGVTTQTGQAGACNATTSTFTLGSTTYTYYTACTDKSDVTTDCNTRYGASCTTGCAGNSPQSINGAATSGTTVYYRVFNKQASSDYLYHSCKADETATKFMRATSGTPLRPLGQPYNTSTSDGSATAAYTNNPAHQISDTSSRYVTMYSVNYLNWKYGPKGPNGAPIGRKTRLQIAKDALTELVANTNGVRFGLMVFNKTDNTVNANSQGGNVVYPIRRMGANSADSDYVNRAALIGKINAVVSSSRTPLTETMYEAYLYFSGQTPKYGTLATAALGGGQVSDGRDTVHDTGTAADTMRGGKYFSPMMANPNETTRAACQKNYVVLITDGGPEDDTDADTEIKALAQAANTYMPAPVTTRQAAYPLTEQFEVTSGVPYGPPDLADTSKYVWLDELTYFMANADISPGGASDTSILPTRQSVNTYAIGFAGANAELLQNAAARGNGLYYQANNSSELSGALSDAIADIRDWNPTGAAPTVPISAYNRSENDKDVYLAFFGPKVNKAWDGTVKKFRISTNSTECGVDYYSRPVNQCLIGQTDLGGGKKNIDTYSVEAGIAQVKVNDLAVSFWSDPADPDGSAPSKGGSGHALKTVGGMTPATRHVYTHITGESELDLTSSANAFVSGNTSITKAMLGNAAMSDGTRSSLINYARGGNPGDAACQGDSASCNVWQSWAHRDVLHSRPAVLTYETSPSLVQYLYYMTNDGLMHAVDTSTGAEQWSFMVEEALPKLSEMMANGIGEHTIGGDGTPVLWVEDRTSAGNPTPNGIIRTSDGDKVYLIFGLRRGGSAYYALDVTTPTAPKFMWKINNALADFTELGESWSTPSVVHMAIGGADPVAVFGGGYDPRPNDMIAAGITRSGTTATVVTITDHGYADGEQVVISGAVQPEYNGTKTIHYVDSRTFTFNVSVTGANPVTPATGFVKVVGDVATSKGRGVFFVNARTGALIKSFTNAAGTAKNIQPPTPMNYSFPSDAIPLNTDQDAAGNVDRLYLGDLGGNIWRFSEDPTSSDGWSVIKFADLSGTDTPKRKIFFPPAVVRQDINGERYDAVYIGTGDRENPLLRSTGDKFFMLKDRHQTVTTTQASAMSISDGRLVDISASSLLPAPDGSGNISYADYDASLKNAIKGSSVDGWMLPLVGDGEKAINAPTVFFNVLRFGSYAPTAQSSPCLPPGEGHLYTLNAKTGGIVDLNKNGTLDTAESRIANDYQLTGYASTGTVAIIDGKVDLMTGINGPIKIENIGTAGYGRYTYWYQEPEQ